MFPPLPASPAHECPPLRLRLLSAAVFALFALLIYDMCNVISSWREVTRCVAFPGEMEIPRINWFVVPYWSIDIMLALSPLLTRRYDEWRALLRRLFWAFTFSCAVFLVLPCRCGFPRSIPDDWTAPLFQLLHFTDLPFNQAPSLHVSEAVIVTPVVLARLSSPWLRAAMVLWIILGSLGTVLVHQHHVVDLVSGAVLGFLLLRLIPRR